jgi:hypothetical protein
MNNAPLGSRLWNLAWKNRHLVQEKCFWEINNGKDALFWEDTWKQLPRLEDQPSHLRLQAGMTTQNKTRVAQYWTEETNSQSLEEMAPLPWLDWRNRQQYHRGFPRETQQKENLAPKNKTDLDGETTLLEPSQ